MNADVIGRVIGRHYRVMEVLGRGGAGTVYKALDDRLQRVVVVKVINLEGQDEGRFLREARSLAALNHPNIVNLYEIGEADGSAYLVMEYVEGRPLSVVLARPLQIEYAVEIIRQVGEALSYAHSQAIIHRDIKPGNILISSRGQVKLSDFGLALVPGQYALTRQGYVLGTPTYMSPEQVRGERLDQRSDIYSLGIVLYEVLTGRPPFSATSAQEMFLQTVSKTPPPLRGLNPAVPAAVERVVLKAIEKDPSQRYQSVDEFIEYLVEASTPSNDSTRAVAPTATPRLRILGVAAIVLTLLLSVAVFQLGPSQGFSTLLMGLLIGILLSLTLSLISYRLPLIGTLIKSVFRTKRGASRENVATLGNERATSDLSNRWRRNRAEVQSRKPERIVDVSGDPVVAERGGARPRTDQPNGRAVVRDEVTIESMPYEESPVAATMLLRREPSAMAWLLILNGSQRGRQFRLADNLSLGRGSQCGVVLHDETVSRTHAEIYLRDGRFRLYDLGSPNGTFVNGVAVKEQELRDRDEIRMGNTIMMFIQAVSPEDLTVEAKRRLREFDEVWNELADSVHDG